MRLRSRIEGVVNHLRMFAEFHAKTEFFLFLDRRFYCFTPQNIKTDVEVLAELCSRVQR